ncbi:MAG: hypothetical protein ABTD50_15635 [Polyangiaceae bacterium]|jgi:hypothetical protein
MESIDLDQLRHQARVAYEWSRLRRALIGFAPALVVAAAASWIGGRPIDSVPFGLGLFLAGSVALWYGREPKRAVLPGIVAGLFPVVLTITTMRVGHMCLGDRCASVCMAACVVGGSGSGLAIGVVGVRRRYRLLFWITASALVLCTGAMGCACLGYSGLVGLATGYFAGVAPALVVRTLRPRGPGSSSS